MGGFVPIFRRWVTFIFLLAQPVAIVAQSTSSAPVAVSNSGGKSALRARPLSTIPPAVYVLMRLLQGLRDFRANPQHLLKRQRTFP
jgi:hypothetical protein